MERLWAPWRMRYVARAEEKASGPRCFLCAGWARPEDDRHSLVLARAGTALALLNRYPYGAGHVLVAPARHLAACADLSAAEAADLWRLLTATQQALGLLMRPDGFNIGINQGAAAGAGVADHLHMHVVPRWAGDHNYMTVLADARVLPEALDETWRRLEPLYRG